MTEKISLCLKCQPIFKNFLDKGGDPSLLQRFSEPAKCINCHKRIKRVREHELKEGGQDLKKPTYGPLYAADQVEVVLTAARRRGWNGSAETDEEKHNRIADSYVKLIK